ncbi:translation initiation factor IF-3, partial [Candidatus Kryptonium thompsonii]
MEKELRVNEQIKVPRVRVIDENGQSIGIMSTRDALRLAEERGYDLVEVAPQANPPVCRLMDYGKYKYEKQKEEKLHK